MMQTLDAYLPEYEFSERHRITVRAAPALVDSALRAVSVVDLPVVRILATLRSLGRRPAPRPLVEEALVLEDASGEGIVLGLVGQFWRLRRAPVPRPADVDEFLAYDRSDVCKAVIDFRVADDELTTETRVHVADPAARRKFARYWRVIRPFSGLTRRGFLREVRRRAEAAV